MTALFDRPSARPTDAGGADVGGAEPPRSLRSAEEGIIRDALHRTRVVRSMLGTRGAPADV